MNLPEVQRLAREETLRRWPEANPDDFEDGAIWLASKLPAREELARWYQENEDVCGSAFDEDDPCYEHQGWCYSFADAILTLINNNLKEN